MVEVGLLNTSPNNMSLDARDVATRRVHLFKDSSHSLHPGLTRYFNSDHFTDLTVVAPDGRHIKCHQVVLSACSKRFANMLEQDSLRNEELPVWGVDSDGLEALLRFFYTGECQMTFTSFVPIWDTAKRLDVPAVVMACEAFLKDVLTPGSSCLVLEQALQLKADDVAERCLSFIRRRFEEVVQREEFFGLTFSTLMKVILDNKDHHDEVPVFRAAWTWTVGDVSHVQYLEELLKVIKVPDMTLNDLMRVGPRGASQSAVGAAFDTPLASKLHNLQAANGVSPPAASSADVQRLLHLSPALQGLQAVQLLQNPNSMESVPLVLLNPNSVQGSISALSTGQNAQLTLDKHRGQQQTTSGDSQPRAMASSLENELMIMDGKHKLGGGENNSGESAMPENGLFNDGPSPGKGMDMLAKLDAQVKLQQLSQPKALSKGVCQVDGCYADLTGLRDYHLRYKICEYHLKVSSIMKDGKPQRFCQQCGRFHYLSEFDGNKRSCRARLMRHNARRRKRPDGSEDAPGQSGSPTALAFLMNQAGKKTRMFGEEQHEEHDTSTDSGGQEAASGKGLGASALALHLPLPNLPALPPPDAALLSEQRHLGLATTNETMGKSHDADAFSAESSGGLEGAGDGRGTAVDSGSGGKGRTALFALPSTPGYIGSVMPVQALLSMMQNGNGVQFGRMS